MKETYEQLKQAGQVTVSEEVFREAFAKDLLLIEAKKEIIHAKIEAMEER